MRKFSIFKLLHISSLWAYRFVTWAVLVCGFMFALLVLGVRFWVLPNVSNYRDTIARELSAATQQRITIGNLEGRWSGLNLQLTLGDLAIFHFLQIPQNNCFPQIRRQFL